MRKTKPVLLLLLTLALALVPPLSAAGDDPRVVILVIDKITLADLTRRDLPNIAWIIGHGGLGLMNNRTGGPPGTANPAYLSIGAGSRALGTPSIGAAYAAADSLEGGTAAEILFRNTGRLADPDDLVLPGVAEILALNTNQERTVRPGLLGRALHEAGYATCALGNADAPGIPGRQIVALLMDDCGLVDRGVIGPETSVPDPAWPFGLRTDYDALLTSYNRLAPGAAVVAIETGDTARLELYAPYLTPARLDVLRHQALSAADGFLGEIRKRLMLRRTMLLLVTPSPTAAALAEGNLLTPLVAMGPGFRPGLLISATTKRPGVVANLDIGPTILAHLNLAVPPEAAGRPMRTTAGADGSPSLLRQGARIAAVEFLRQPILKFYTVFLDVIFIVCALFLLWQGLPRAGALPDWCHLSTGMVQSGPKRPPGLPLAGCRMILLPAAVIPFVLLVGPIHPAVEYLPWLAGLVLILTAALSAVGRRQPSRPISLLCTGTVAVIAFDQVCGGWLARYSMLSYSPVTGARYYGLGNEYMGVLIGAAITGAALAYERWRGRRWLSFAVGITFLGLTAIIGLPNMGANVGGSLAAVVGFGIAFLIMEGKRVSWRTLLMAVGLAGSTLVLLALADFLRPPAAQTHLGRLVGSIGREGMEAFWQVAARKIAMNVKLIRYSGWSRVILFTLLAMASLFHHPEQRRELACRYPYLAKGSFACLAGAAAAFIFNDSGVLAAATLIVYPATAWLYVTLRERTSA